MGIGLHRAGGGDLARLLRKDAVVNWKIAASCAVVVIAVATAVVFFRVMVADAPAPVPVPADVLESKAAALAALDAAALLGDGQPLGAEYDEIDRVRRNADALLLGGRFTDAKAGYDLLLEKCCDLERVEALRQEALAAKAQAVSLCRQIAGLRAFGNALALRVRAQQLLVVAQDLFNNGSFGEALHRWLEARACCNEMLMLQARITDDEPAVETVPVVALPTEFKPVPKEEMNYGFSGIYVNRNPRERMKSLLRFEGSGESEKAVEAGLAWLARTQEPDGHWDSKKWGAASNVDAGLTGLAVLAFLGNGRTDRHGPHTEVVATALDWLEKKAGEQGTWGDTFYTQGICTMALCEAFALTKDQRRRAAAQRAVDFCCANQNPNGGWDYHGNNPQRVDTSVSVWVMMAVRAGMVAGLNVRDEHAGRIRKWLNEAQNADGTTGYTKNIGARGSSGGISVPALTAAATLGKFVFDEHLERERVAKSLDFIEKAGVSANNLYHVYYGSLCMFQAGGEHWQRWNRQVRDALVAKQVKGRGPEVDGSWDVSGDILGQQGGRIYTTAMATLSLETYYRFRR